MHAVLGATGHVGSSVISHLLHAGEEVLAITHSHDHVEELTLKGAKVALVDVRDSQKLAETLKGMSSVFVLNPPGDVSKDSLREESETVKSIVEALKIARPERLVVESTQGAQKGEMLGDLGVLFDLEEGIRNLGIPTSVTRAGFYMSNWDAQLESAKNGKIQSLFPADFKMPMAAPRDLGQFNAEKMLEGKNSTFDIVDFNGPTHYSANDVASAFARALNRPVQVEIVPQEKWKESFKKLGFSDISAQSYSRMSEVALNQRYDKSDQSVEGRTTLEEYVSKLVNKAE